MIIKVLHLFFLLFSALFCNAQKDIKPEIIKIKTTKEFDIPTQLNKLLVLYNVDKKSITVESACNLEQSIAEIYYSQGESEKCIEFARRGFKTSFSSEKKTDIVVASVNGYYFLKNCGIEKESVVMFDTASYYVKKWQLNTVKNLNKEEQIAYGTYCSAIAEKFSDSSKPKESLLYYKIAKELFEKSNDTISLALVYHQMGFEYDNLNDASNAIQSYLEAIKLREKIGLDSENGYTLNNICADYIFIKEYDKALVYINKAVAQSRKSQTLDILFNSLRLKGNVLYHKEKYTEAEKYLKESVMYANKLGNVSNAAVCKSDLALVYGRQKKYIEEIAIYTEVKKIYDSLGMQNTRNYFALFRSMGIAYKNNNQLDKAVYYLDMALVGFTKTKNYDMLQKTFFSISDVYKRKGNFEKALMYKDSCMLYRDSVQVKQNNTKYKEIEEKYGTASKELTIKNLETQQQKKDIEISKSRNRNIIFLVIAAALLTLLALVIRFNNKTKKQKLILEQSNIKLENANVELADFNETQTRLFSIISHDLKGMIIPFHRAGRILKSYVQKNDMENAVTLTEKLEQNALRLSGTLNNLLYWALHQMKGIQLKKESINIHELIDHVAEHYFDIMKHKHILFKNNTGLQDIVTVDEEVTNIVLRNLISNAVKYTENGSITISAENIHDSYKITVTDTGAGMDKEVLDKIYNNDSNKIKKGTQGEMGSGLGIVIIQKLLLLHEVEMNIESEVNRGTSISLLYNKS